MAHNYSQPFYGFPFAYPPAQSGEPSAPPNGQPASAPDAFQSIPGLGSSQNHPPFPAPAWPPQFPLDQNMWPPQQFLPFLQNGMLPPPPFFHPPTFPPTFPPAPQHATLSSHPPQSSVPASDRIQEVMDSDREDGEVSDGDAPSQQPLASGHVKANGTSNAHREPPRSVPQAPQPSSAKAPASTQEDTLQRNRDEAREFIKMLNSNNIGYPALANEGLDKELLRDLYQSLNLPSEPASIPTPKANGTLPKLPAQTPTSSTALPPPPTNKAQQQKPAPIVKTNVAAAPSAKSAASPTGPVDRKDYIARLQAAKMAKQAGAAKPSSPQSTPPTQAISPVVAVNTPQAATTPTAKPPVTDEQRARNTELIKQRLEAMRAKQKSSVPVVNKMKPSSSLSQRPEQAHDAAEPTTQVAQASTSIPTTPTNMPSFPGIPGIPGLFMSNPVSSVPQKRPVPSDTEPSTPQVPMAPYNQPLGQSPHARQTMAAEVSDNESNGSAMDIDDDQMVSKPLVVSQPNSQSQHQGLGDMAEGPSRPTSTKPTSTVGTPGGAQTPAIAIREKELEDKEKQLAAMRLTLKKKLAEKREKDRAAAAAAAAATVASSPLRQDVVTLMSPPQSISASEPVAEVSHPVRLRPTDDPDATTHSVIEPVRNTKRLRRAEIQSKLPSLDAEIATNTSRIAQLTREMEELTAQNERIAKDKEQLTLELESLGIDTEGMSHEELRAKKEEIQHEQSPEPGNMSQRTGSVSQPALHGSTTTSPENLQYMAPPHADFGESTSAHSWPAPVPPTGGYAQLPGLGQVSQTRPGSVLEPREKAIALPTPQDESQLNRLVVGDGATGMSVHATSRSGTRLSATPLDDDEDFYSPPAVELDVDETAEMQPAVESLSEEGEVEMSESSDEDEEEEEYEPDEPMDLTSTLLQEAQSTAPSIGHSLARSQMSTEDEEDYEPPDVEDDVLERAQSSQIEPDEDAMDLAISSSEASSDTDSDEETTPEPEARMSISDNAPQLETNVTNDLAPGMQVQVVPALPDSEPAAPAGDEEEKVTFTPYESPLRFFKSYRYHPSYAHDVAGGFLSLTYSHQIDPEKLLCPHESAGVTCTDAHCQHQHFRDLSITGEKLLVQLGTANPGKTHDEKQKWNDGLRSVLRELRQKNIRDPNGIAIEIAKYRREFLNDDTRVINL